MNTEDEEVNMTTSLEEYISATIKQNNCPLPILQRITDDFIFPLVNYQLNPSNSRSLSMILPKLIPRFVKEVYFINNGISEKELAKLISGAFKAEGLRTFGVLQNCLSNYVLKAIADRVISTT